MDLFNTEFEALRLDKLASLVESFNRELELIHKFEFIEKENTDSEQKRKPKKAEPKRKRKKAEEPKAASPEPLPEAIEESPRKKPRESKGDFQSLISSKLENLRKELTSLNARKALKPIVPVSVIMNTAKEEPEPENHQSIVEPLPQTPVEQVAALDDEIMLDPLEIMLDPLSELEEELEKEPELELQVIVPETPQPTKRPSLLANALAPVPTVVSSTAVVQPPATVVTVAGATTKHQQVLLRKQELEQQRIQELKKKEQEKQKRMEILKQQRLAEEEKLKMLKQQKTKFMKPPARPVASSSTVANTSTTTASSSTSSSSSLIKNPILTQLSPKSPMIGVATIVDDQGDLPEIMTDYSDEEVVEKKKVPLWAQTPNLNKTLEQQLTRDPDAIFGRMTLTGLNGEFTLILELFATFRNVEKFRARESSMWTDKDRLTVKEEVAYKQRMNYH